MSYVNRATSVALDPDQEGNVDDCVDIIIPSHDGTPFFEAGDGDLQLWVGEECFETHKYLIKRFKGLKGLLHTHATTATLHVPPGLGGHNSEDFRRTLKVLYASILEGPFELDSGTLVSALRIATVFDYPILRAYAINHLEQTQLSATERIKVAREFDLSSWEEPAYLELCERDEAMTMEEATALGLDAFVRVTKIREMDRERKHRNEGPHINAQGAMESGPTEPPNRPSTHRARPQTEDNSGPSYINARLGHDYTWDEWYSDPGKHLPVPGCRCRFLNREGTSVCVEKTCKITPCAVMAFRKLQTQQAAHTNTIARLESTLEQLISPPERLGTSRAPPGIAPQSAIQEEIRHMIRVLRESRARG